MVLHTCNLITYEAEEGGSLGVQGHPVYIASLRPTRAKQRDRVSKKLNKAKTIKILKIKEQIKVLNGHFIRNEDQMSKKHL